jgi:murein DD-endopeptidase MepM/ murein hydrolase activator NlpD
MTTANSSILTRVFLIGLAVIVLLLMGYLAFRKYAAPANRTAQVLEFLRNPVAHPDWMVRAGERCGDAPFILPTDGFIGYLWDDSFRVGHRHQGIDIFGGTDVGVTPVLAAYPGYLSRLEDWKSSVIVRVPEDPLNKGRQIWVYYTHMAGPSGDSTISPEFPAGVEEVYVEAGTLLGYQGNYSGDPGNPVGVHLHFSIVLDDGSGRFLNELQIENTLDPSPYLGLPLNAIANPGEIPLCREIP